MMVLASTNEHYGDVLRFHIVYGFLHNLLEFFVEPLHHRHIMTSAARIEYWDKFIQQ